MEERSSPLNFYICQTILENTLIDSVVTEAERLENMLNFFSYKHSENLSTAMISTSNYFHGNPINRLTQDYPTETIQKKSFKVRDGLKFYGKGKSNFLPQKKMDTKSSKNLNSEQNEEMPGLRLIPLRLEEQQSIVEVEQDQIQQKMREMKVHQQNVRSRYAQNMRQKNKRTLTFHKMDAKTTPKVPIYDYDGSLVAPLKADGHRLPFHYLDLQVNVQEQEKQDKVTYSKIKKEKLKNIVKFDQQTKKQNLRPVHSSFLKGARNIQWVQGVQPQSNKEECRKILGYSYNQLTHKKKIDLFKPSDKPVKIKFQQLENFKNQVKRISQSEIELNPTKKIESSHTFLNQQENRRLMEGNKTIQVANNKALQFLIREDQECLPYKKLSVFSNAKSFHCKPSQSSASFYKIINSNIIHPSKSSNQVFPKKRKAQIKQRINDRIVT